MKSRTYQFKIKRVGKSENNSEKEGKQKPEKTSETKKETESHDEEQKARKTTESEPEQGFNFEEDSGKSESVSENTDEKKNDKNQNPPVQHNSALAFLLNFLDVCASLFFIASIVVILKPHLISRLNLPAEQIPKIAVAIFTVLKCAVAFYSKNTARKIIAILLVVILILSNLLLSYSLIMNQDGSEIFIIVSVILCLLSYFAFEFSCGFKTENILKKIVAIAILGFVLYVAVHYTIYPKANKEVLIDSAKFFWYQLSEFCKTL